MSVIPGTHQDPPKWEALVDVDIDSSMATFGAERVIWEKKFRERSHNRTAHYSYMHNTWQVFEQAGAGDMWKLERAIKAGGDVVWHNPKRGDRTALMQAAMMGQLMNTSLCGKVAWYSYVFPCGCAGGALCME